MEIYENIKNEIEALYSRLQKQQNLSSKEELGVEKDKLAQEYGLTKAEMEQLIEQIQHSFFLFQKSSHDYNNADIYYNDSEIDTERKELETTIKKNLEKYIIRQRISEIKPDEITPELIQALQKSGYDGKTGHPVLQSYFSMYFNIQENEGKSKIDKDQIATLEAEVGKRQDIIEVLTTRDNML